jgi:hypothetical protein
MMQTGFHVARKAGIIAEGRGKENGRYELSMADGQRSIVNGARGFFQVFMLFSAVL